MNRYFKHVINYLNESYVDINTKQITDKMIIKLPYGYFSPNTNFFENEMYYWDSFFTIKFLHLYKHNKFNVMDTLNNFAYLIDKFGFIPNANRYDFLSRSQMPLFGLSIYETKNTSNIRLMKSFYEEMQWWEQYPHPKYHKFKKSSKNSYFRYFADYNESTSVCESGWDYSRRWFFEDKSGILREKITSLWAIDLNTVMLFNLKLLKSMGYKIESDVDYMFENFDSFFWSKDLNFYVDYNFETQKQSKYRTLAGFMPMYFNLTSSENASKMVLHLKDFLYPHGLSVMPKRTIEEEEKLKYEKKMQWDYPNGWAPLHYFVVIGLLNYNYVDLAKKIMRCFCNGCEEYFDKYSTFPEKILVDPISKLKPSDYSNQDGFGWTNAVYGIFSLILDNKVDTENLKVFNK